MSVTGRLCFFSGKPQQGGLKGDFRPATGEDPSHEEGPLHFPPEPPAKKRYSSPPKRPLEIKQIACPQPNKTESLLGLYLPITAMSTEEVNQESQQAINKNERASIADSIPVASAGETEPKQDSVTEPPLGGKPKRLAPSSCFLRSNPGFQVGAL